MFERLIFAVAGLSFGFLLVFVIIILSSVLQ
jgi:hypothetical protein